MNKGINPLKNYIITIIVTAIAVISLSFCVELELLFRTETKVNSEELNVENLVEFCTIEQLEKYLQKNPKDYFAKIKLAGIYEYLKEYETANKLYLEAVGTSVRSNFALYSYGEFCARRGMFNLAATLADELMEVNDKAFEYRAKIYNQIAEKLKEKKQYEAIVSAYQIAYKYAKNSKDAEFREYIKSEYAKSYILLADENIKNNKIKEAISNLNNSLKIKESDEARYKLGLIYINVDKFIAEKHISSVFKKNIFMVNPYIYNSLLSDLSNESKNTRGLHSSDYYMLKLNSFKKKLSENYVYKNDILIENSYIAKKKKLFSKDFSYYLVFDIENNTKVKIPELYLQVILYVDKNQYKVDKKMFSYTHPLDFYEIIEQNKILLPKSFKLNNLKEKNEIIIKYFARKNENAPWTLLKIDSLNI